MIPILYDAFETEFNTNGIGFLTDAISCIVTEERNGIYELKLSYPVQGHLYDYLCEEAIIKAKANDEDEPQLFRIYQSGRTINNTTTWYAEHISYELNGNPVEKYSVSNVNASVALNRLLEKAVFSHKFKAYSDILTTNSTSFDTILSVRNILGGTEGSLLDKWRGEYHFDNYKIEFLKSRGEDRGVTIEYGKNLIDATQDKSIDSVVTSIFPYAVYQKDNEGADIVVTLNEKIIKHNAADNYAAPKCEIVDLSEEFESGVEITQSMLREKALGYLNDIETEPKVNLTLSFVALSKTKDYKNLQAMENIRLCDTVTVRIPKHGIDIKEKVTKVKYNTLKERYESIEVGEVKTNLVKELVAEKKSTEQVILSTGYRAEQIRQQIENTIKDVTAAITGNSGGYVLIHPEKNPQEIFIMDTPDIATAKNVWRWNLAGLGHSSNGVNGPFTTAITADGQIVANFITAGELTGQLLKAGTVYAEALDIEYRKSVLNYTDDKNSETITELTSRIETTAEEINMTCEALQKNIDTVDNYTKAQIKIANDNIALKVSKGDVSSQISQEASKITISSNRLKINSTYFTLSEDGDMTLTKGTINITTAAAKESKIELNYGSYKAKLAPAEIACGDTSAGYTQCIRSDEISSSWGTSSETSIRGGTINTNTMVPDEVLAQTGYFGSYVSVGGSRYEDNAFTVRGSAAIIGDFKVVGEKNRLVYTKDYGKRLMNALETAQAYFGDMGMGRIGEDGTCTIYIDSIFAETVEENAQKIIQLTKYGQGDIWIESEDTYYFIAKGTKGLKFSWQLYLPQKGYAGVRLQEDIGTTANEDNINIENILYEIQREEANQYESIALAEINSQINYEDEALNYLDNWEKEILNYGS